MSSTRTMKPTVTTAMGEFGRRVRNRRRQLSLSQEGLAADTTLHWSYLGRIERGTVNVTLATILQLADVLDVDPASLIAGLDVDRQPGT